MKQKDKSENELSYNHQSCQCFLCVLYMLYLSGCLMVVCSCRAKSSLVSYSLLMSGWKPCGLQTMPSVPSFVQGKGLRTLYSLRLLLQGMQMGTRSVLENVGKVLGVGGNLYWGISMTYYEMTSLTLYQTVPDCTLKWGFVSGSWTVKAAMVFKTFQDAARTTTKIILWLPDKTPTKKKV